MPEIETYREYVEKIKWYQQLHEEVRVKAKKNIYEAEERYKNYEQEIKRIKEFYKNNEDNYKKLEQENIRLQEEVNKKQAELDKVYNSKVWKCLEKLRKIKNKK